MQENTKYDDIDEKANNKHSKVCEKERSYLVEVKFRLRCWTFVNVSEIDGSEDIVGCGYEEDDDLADEDDEGEDQGYDMIVLTYRYHVI